ncbi:MAG: RDD family protein [Bacteroidetes bacterium]|nr:RDD family protein [Bacteroidota bacterium]
MTTRDEQLRFCKICKNQKFDFQQGIMCGLTDKPADFQVSCPSFVQDSAIVLNEITDESYQENHVSIKIASQGKRFANHLLDIIFYLIFTFLFGIFLGVVFAILAPDLLTIFEEDNRLLNYLVTIIAGLIYYTGFEYLTGRTLAKFITKTRVVTIKGQKPEFETIFIRSLCRFIPFDALSFLGQDGIGWHDTISKTRVIDES